MRSEEQDLAQQLKQELEEIRFLGADKVIHRTFPKTGRERLSSLWNKEIEISAAAIGYLSAAVAVLLFGGLLWKEATVKPAASVPFQASNELLEAGGSYYWKDQYERMVARLENSDQD
jgi:hypothetical protein